MHAFGTAGLIMHGSRAVLLGTITACALAAACGGGLMEDDVYERTLSMLTGCSTLLFHDAGGVASGQWPVVAYAYQGTPATLAVAAWRLPAGADGVAWHLDQPRLMLDDLRLGSGHVSRGPADSVDVRFRESMTTLTVRVALSGDRLRGRLYVDHCLGTDSHDGYVEVEPSPCPGHIRAFVLHSSWHPHRHGEPVGATSRLPLREMTEEEDSLFSKRHSD
jgi:hypothetical protein